MGVSAEDVQGGGNAWANAWRLGLFRRDRPGGPSSVPARPPPPRGVCDQSHFI